MWYCRVQQRLDSLHLFAVGVSLEDNHLGLDLLHKIIQGLPFKYKEQSLDDIVAVLIPYQILQIAVPLLIHRRQDADDSLLLLKASEFDACLHHITGEFMLRIIDDIRRHQRDDPSPVFLTPVLNDVLSDIVAVLVTDEVLRAAVELLQNGRSSRLDAVLQHALYDSTAVGMFRKLMHLACKCIDNELDVLGRNPFNGLLHHMVAILILDAFHDLFVLLELSDQ